MHPDNAGQFGETQIRIRATVTMPRLCEAAGSETSNLCMEQCQIGEKSKIPPSAGPKHGVIRSVILSGRLQDIRQRRMLVKWSSPARVTELGLLTAFFNLEKY